MSLWTRGVVACTGLLLLGGCSGPVEIDPGPALTRADEQACRELLAALPTSVAGQEARDVTPEDAPGAAWGDPPIVLTCGVPEPADFTRTSTCIQADGVGWYVPDDVLLADDESRDVTMTAVGYRPRVEVVLPGRYRPEGFMSAAVEIGRVVDETLTLERRCR